MVKFSRDHESESRYDIITRKVRRVIGMKDSDAKLKEMYKLVEELCKLLED